MARLYFPLTRTRRAEDRIIFPFDSEVEHHNHAGGTIYIGRAAYSTLLLRNRASGSIHSSLCDGVCATKGVCTRVVSPRERVHPRPHGARRQRRTS